MIKEILKEVQNKLSTASSLRYIDENWGQLDLDVPAVQYPAALIDIGEIGFVQVGDFAQKATGTIIITIADMKLSNSSFEAPQSQKDNNFAFFDILQEIHEVLQLQKLIDNSEPIERVFVRKMERMDGIREYQIGYLLKYKEED